MIGVRQATTEEVDRWDVATVEGRGGHVLQSRAWAEHRRATGWQPHYLVATDGAYVLALTRRWPLLRGGSAYIPRGPIPDIDEIARLASRLAAVADHLAAQGFDVVATDAEIPARTGYPDAIGRLGFHAIEEIQPSRHRMAIPLGEGADEGAVHAAIAKATRARIRAAEVGGIVVRRYDGRPGSHPDGDAPTPTDMPIEEARSALAAFYDLETLTATRRGFALGPRSRFLDWWGSALRAGHLILLDAMAPDDATGPIGGVLLYRHGGRLTTVQSADRMDMRRRFPGVLHLLRWRAIQQAIAEGCDEMDLGGADVAGARREPLPGEPMYGLYEHKVSFGARWVAMSGAHERAYRPIRYACGRALARLGRTVGGGS